LAGVPGARSLLVDTPPHWPRLELEVRVTGGAPPRGEEVGESSAVLRPRSGGWVNIDRASGTATFSLPERPTDGALVHPHLASVAIVAAHWLGHETFHAGAFIVGGRAWGVLGQRQAGKSSLLASLSLVGVPVVSDDVLVLDGTTVFAGPRSIDLRPDAAKRLGVGEDVGMMGARERWRLGLDPVEAELQMGGWLSLLWDDAVAMREIRGAERLQTLGAHRASSLYPPDPAGLLDLCALPCVELRRPRRWELTEDTLRRLLDSLD
jgi:hypothetical protein